jgi:sn-glycerol 3-phosphate transport system ATP-binding protein
MSAALTLFCFELAAEQEPSPHKAGVPLPQRLRAQVCYGVGSTSTSFLLIRYQSNSHAGESIMAQIEFRKVTKSFDKVKVIEDLDLVIPDGKFTVLVGASGCGKTTLLRMIAGIGPATSGQLLLDDTDITDLAPGKRDIAMVFQNYAIYPTMTVRENIEFGLKNNKVPKGEREKRISEVAASVGLTEYLDRKPSTLSGGQRQRIALARAMVKQPKVFLMDEPLSNLDAKLRATMRTELIELHERLKTTFVYVTHDQVEAMAMADLIVLMDKGKIMQKGTPEKIYRDPDNIFAAQFIGTPAMNIFAMGDSGIRLGFRPEKAMLSKEPISRNYVQQCKIITREMLGSETIYKVQMCKENVMAKSTDESFQIGDSCYLSVTDDHLYFFDKDGRRIRRADVDNYDELIKIAGVSCHA